MQGDKPNKTLILMRGLPGSGKSTKAKKLAGNEGLVYSTDDFFMVEGVYKYDGNKIAEYHNKNYDRTVASMKEGKLLIIVDNTNIRLWEMRKYVEAGEQFGYAIKIEEADSPWAFNHKQCAKRNSHGVPQDTCKNMRDNQQVCENIEQIKAAKQTRRKR